MFSFYFKQDDSIEIDGRKYQLNISFDNILKVIELMKEERPRGERPLVELSLEPGVFFRTTHGKTAPSC